MFFDEFVVGRKEIRPAQENGTGQKSQGSAESQDRVGIGDYCFTPLSVVSGASKESQDKVSFCEIIVKRAFGCEQRKPLLDHYRNHIVKSSSAREANMSPVLQYW